MVKEDQRIIKTKEKFSQALISLLKEKSVQDIKISELCERAHISRATFYNNFTTIEDVLNYYIEKFEVPLEAALERDLQHLDLSSNLNLPSLWKAFIFPIVEELEKISNDIYEIFNDDKLSQDLYQVILRFIEKSMYRILPFFKTQVNINVPDEVAIPYCAGGMCSLIFALIKAGDKYTLEEKQYYVYHFVFEMDYIYYKDQNLIKG